MSQPSDDAYTTLYNEVHAPVFFAKLAEHGIVPRNDEERCNLLKIGHQLHQLEQNELLKQAADQGAFIADAAAELDQLLGWQPEAQDQGIKAAADHFAANPALLQAAMAFNDAA